MSRKPFGRVRQFFAELKRRNVYQVAVTYAVVGFVLIQVADLSFVRLGLPSWTVTFLIVLVAMGFPLALVLAWAFERTPEGVRRTAGAGLKDELAPEEGEKTRAAYKLLIGLGLLAAAVAGGWFLTGGGVSDTEPRLGDQSLVVLPFEALGQQNPGTFTEGMHDALLTRLSNVSDLTVISRTAVQQYRDTDKTTGEIARELGVRWVLEGGVQEMGDQIQVNAQLIDPRTEGHKWADSYRRDLTAEDLFAIQTEITKKIARSLEAELGPAEAERVERQPTQNLDAYRLYVQGRSHLDQRTEPGIRRGMKLFEQAIAEDSTYALAWSGLADAQQLYSNYYGSDTLGASTPSPEAAARRALRLDSTSAEAHASLGHLLMHQQEGPAAVRELERALELRPSYARAHHWLGILLERLGRLQWALPRKEQAVELDPMSPPIHVALSAAYRYAGRPEGALEEARRAAELAPGYRSAFIWMAGALLDMGRSNEALAVVRRLMKQTEPDAEPPAEVRGALAVALARAGKTGRSRKLLDRLEAKRGVPYWVVMIRSELGEKDAAISALQKAGLENLTAAPLRYEPILDPLRDDPRYRELIRKLNRQWGLNPDGSLPDSVELSFGSEAEN